MSNSLYTKNRVIAPIVIGVSILIGVLFVKPLYMSYIDTSSQLSSVQSDLAKKKADRDTLLNIKNNSGSGMSEALLARVKQLDQKFIPSDIIAEVMLNAYTEKSGDALPMITISNISVDKGSKLPSGLSLGKVNIALQSSSIENIVEYLTFLTTKSHFAFTLDDISLPIDTAPENALPVSGYGLAISLGVYYYE